MFLQLTDFIMDNLQYILPALIIFLFLTLIFFIKININLSKLNKRYEILMRGTNRVNLENNLFAYAQDVKKVKVVLDNLSARLDKLEEFERTTMKNIGVVKFDAFDDIAGELSFAIALLNEKKNGFILSTISTRNESRVYIKPVVGGQSSYHLTPEEKEAIAKAAILK